MEKSSRTKTCRTTSHLLATAGVAAMLSIASPAWAADINAPGKQAAGLFSVKTASAIGKRHHVLPRRLAASHAPRIRYADAAPSGLQCTTSWCGRPYVLMIGIGF
jgi:hypothetical protein